jgi:hypothetical protein
MNEDCDRAPVERTVRPLTQNEIETLEGMKDYRWYYTLGCKFQSEMDELVALGLVESGPNPCAKWPAYRLVRVA